MSKMLINGAFVNNLPYKINEIRHFEVLIVLNTVADDV